MGQIVVFTSLSLDGVMQAPGRPDEDTRGGFQHGGWALPYSDPKQGKAVGESMSTTGTGVVISAYRPGYRRSDDVMLKDK